MRGDWLNRRMSSKLFQTQAEELQRTITADSVDIGHIPPTLSSLPNARISLLVKSPIYQATRLR